MPKGNVVLNAVIDFKGELPNSCALGVYAEPTVFISCGEFNALVGSLASNMGRATQTYAEYKKEFGSAFLSTLKLNLHEGRGE